MCTYRHRTAILAASLMLILLSVGELAADDKLELTLPDLDWALLIDAPNFEIEGAELRPDGMAMSLMVQNRQTGLIMSVFIEPAPFDGTSHDCRKYYWNLTKQSPLVEEDVVFREDGPMALVEYFIREAQGITANQKHVNAYLAKDNFWIDVHLSKIEYTDADRGYFDDVLASISIDNNYTHTVFSNFAYATAFFSYGNLERAIVQYEKVLKSEAESPQLGSDLWRVSVDHLGIAYGMSGDLANSRRVYLEGIERYPTYPMFYYNLACTYSEMDDRENAIANLRKAYEYRANMMGDEKLPDPRTDPSFERYLGDPVFVAALIEMEG